MESLLIISLIGYGVSFVVSLIFLVKMSLNWRELFERLKEQGYSFKEWMKSEIKGPFYLAENPITLKKAVEASFIGGVFVTAVIGLLGTLFTILGKTTLMLVYLASILTFILTIPIFLATFMFRRAMEKCRGKPLISESKSIPGEKDGGGIGTRGKIEITAATLLLISIAAIYYVTFPPKTYFAVLNIIVGIIIALFIVPLIFYALYRTSK